MHCLHCNSITNNVTEDFCCKGCEKVYNYISSSNLGDHYRYCNEIYNTKPQKVEIKGICIEDFKECVVEKDTANELILHIPEIFCGACVWLIETAFKKIDILQATVNLTLKTLTIAWNGNIGKIEDFITLINNLGYNCYPFVEDQVLLQNRNLEFGYLKRIGVSGLALMFVMVISFCIWIGNRDGSMHDYTRAFFHIVNYVVTIPALIYSSRPFFIKALSGLKNKSMDMNLPISIAIIMMIIISVQETFLGGEYSYFDSALSLVFALLIGKYLEQKARNKAVYQAYSHISNLPKMVNVLEEGNIVIKNIKNVKCGEILLVEAGEIVPLDGLIVQGISSINNQIITGESAPQDVSVSDQVFAGAINISASITIRVSTPYNESYIVKLQKMALNCNKISTKLSVIANQITRWYVPITILLFIASFVLWLNISDMRTAFYVSTSLLVITCPCAVGIAIPLANFIASNSLLAKGIYIRSENALEKMKCIKGIFYDKTGTLTTGDFKVDFSSDITAEEKEIIYSMAIKSSHPIAKSICRSLHTLQLSSRGLTTGSMVEEPRDQVARRRDGSVILAIDVEEKKGQGLVGRFEDDIYLLGNKELVIAYRHCEPLQGVARNDEGQVLYFKYNDNPIKLIYIEDELRPDVKKIVEFFASYNLRQAIVSGDESNAVKKVAGLCQINEYYSKQKPEDKLNLIKDNKQVMFVGDGINDSICMAESYLSVSHEAGTAIAKHASDIVLTGQGLVHLIYLYKYASRYHKVLFQNFLWSFIYNAITLPSAFLGHITPLYAAVFMSLSSIFVILNSLRLRL